MLFLNKTEDLRLFCESLSSCPYVTVDTEFMREKTYFAKLCLVQLAGPQEAAVIDPLAEGMDLAPLFELMRAPQVLKVFHAARQDVEIFVQLMGAVPSPLFDTQIAAMVCGYGEAASYETLASSLADAKIDKSSRFTDWSRRPLTDQQIDYALADVTHLRTVYEKLRLKLEKNDRSEWCQEEIAVITSLETYKADPEEAWKRLKFRTDKPRRLAVLKSLAAWREREAKEANLPRGRVLKDETLIEIANQSPTNAAELSRTRGLSQGFAEGRHGLAILDAVKEALSLPPDLWPVVEKKKTLPHGASATIELLKVLLHHVSEKEGVATKLIASSDDLERLAAESAPDIKPLRGWRRALFGEEALALKRGEVALAIKNGKVAAIRP